MEDEWEEASLAFLAKGSLCSFEGTGKKLKVGAALARWIYRFACVSFFHQNLLCKEESMNDQFLFVKWSCSS